MACCGFATRNRASAGSGPRPPGTRTWLRGARSTDPEAMPETRSAAPGQKSPRWSAERRASLRWGTIRRLASAWRAALWHVAGAAAPERRLGAPPPLVRGGNETSGATRWGKERYEDDVADRKSRIANREQIVGWVEFFTRPNIARSAGNVGSRCARPNLRHRETRAPRQKKAPPKRGQVLGGTPDRGAPPLYDSFDSP